MEIKLTEEMYNRALISKGDISRILKMIDKAEKGEDITIAFLGGSITQGCNASVYEKCYVNLTYNYFKNKFKNINVQCINAGVGATGSLIGVHRAQKQVLDKKPDIIFVDAAVNDSEEFECKVSYESEIRTLLSDKNKPAVVEVFMTMDTGFNVQEQEIEVGKRYNVSMLSYRNAVYEETVKGNIKWPDIITDEVHPNDAGHAIITEIIGKFIDDIYENDYKKGMDISIKDDSLEKEIVYGDRYTNGTIINNKDTHIKDNKGFVKFEEGFQAFHDGWKFEGESGTEGKLIAEAEAKNIILLYKEIRTDAAAILKVTIDKDKTYTIDTHFNETWGDHTATKILLESEQKKKHEIEISVEDKGLKREVTILGFMLS